MSTTRVVIKQGEKAYRFLKFVAQPDGSLLIFLDRDQRASKEAGYLSLTEGNFVPDADVDNSKPTPSAKISCHTTGEIHYYAGGNRKETFHIDPLYQLASHRTVGFFSIPMPARLDSYNLNKHQADVVASLEIPPEIVERVTFLVDLAPADAEHQITFGASLKYEVYSVGVRLVAGPPVAISGDLQNHFVHGILKPNAPTTRAVDKALAELAFRQAIHGKGPIVIRASDGSYVALATVPKISPPKLMVEFDRQDLRVEKITPQGGHLLTHKVRFWIYDRTGRNKSEDLRRHIKSISFSSEL